MLILKPETMQSMKRLIIYTISALLMVACGGHKQTVRPVQNESSGIYSGKKDHKDVNEYSAELVKEARKWLGTKYKYAGENRKGTDCSGMVMSIYRDVAGIKLPRSSREQQSFCKSVKVADLTPGDLIFFSGSSRGGKVSHVGMYIGDGDFIHASLSKGVIVSNLNESYYSRHFHSAGRVPGIHTAKGKYRAEQNHEADAEEKYTPGFTLTPVEALPGRPAAVPETIRVVEIIRDTVYVPITAPSDPGSDSIGSEVRRAMQF